MEEPNQGHPTRESEVVAHVPDQLSTSVPVPSSAEKESAAMDHGSVEGPGGTS